MFSEFDFRSHAAHPLRLILFISRMVSENSENSFFAAACF